MDDDERNIVNSPQVQRLREIHQLAMTYMVYPGASHKRFEHALGVMELAGRVYDVLVSPENWLPEIRALLTRELGREDQRLYWRRVVRMAALCHDLGHLPFSHAAEHATLPEGWSHERISREIILSPQMRALWNSMTPPPRAEDIAKLSVGPQKAREEFSDMEAVLSEIIVSDTFGTDRIDYLLRDSHHLGVGYGKFDHFRLIETMRILPKSRESETDHSDEPMLGVERGGLHGAEALLIARYFMFSQVYYHLVRRIYDSHLIDFLSAWLGGYFPTDIEQHSKYRDTEVIYALREASLDPTKPGHEWAKRIATRDHFRLIYSGGNPRDRDIFPNPGQAIAAACQQRYGNSNVRHQAIKPGGPVSDFPVLDHDGQVVSSRHLSDTLRSTPTASADYMFVAPEHRSEAERWINEEKESILEQAAISLVLATSKSGTL